MPDLSLPENDAPVADERPDDDGVDTKVDKKKGKKTKEADKEKKQSGLSVVGAAIKEFKTFNAKPNLKADYYIYLCSASWCGPCRREMPTIAEEYKAMKRSKKVEILLVGFDRTEEEALNYLKSFKAKFPGITKDQLNEKKVTALPGFSIASGIPYAVVVDKEGNVITQGHGSLVKDWKKYTIDRKKSK